ncbi:MAG: arsenate reductase ArsC [Pseudobdellovibrionaceae bacterium]
MKILFLCVANSARSQMAEGLARVILGKNVSVESAGSIPAKQVNPFAVQVMAEKGFDITAQMPKSVDSIDLNSVDLIITLCAEEICPVTPSKTKVIRWPLSDPAIFDSQDQLKRFRETRDELHRRISDLLAKREVSLYL